jgi:hypothetical protein
MGMRGCLCRGGMHYSGLNLGGHRGEGESHGLDQGGGGPGTIAEREARERVLKAKVESAA